MSQLFPRSLLEFEHWFRTEEACREYLIRLRWPEGFRCRCGYAKAWVTKRGLLHCGKCRRDTYPRAGTIFESSHLTLRLWFRAIWLVTNQKTGISALGLQRALGLGSYETAWTCLHKLRRAMVRPGREALAGEVEVDETLIGGHEQFQGRRTVGKKSLVLVAAQVRGDGIGRIRLQQAPDTSKEHLMAFVREAVVPGSVVITDGLPVYMNVVKIGYAHRPRVPPRKQEASKLLPRVHRVSALLKRWLMGVHQGAISRQQLSCYLDEFVFRFNRRLSPTRGMLFYRLLQQAVDIEPVPYSDISKGA